MTFNKLILFAFVATLGCALGNSIISRRTYPMVGTNHCTWGPSYWCAHISRAKECGTLKHCASVWGKESLNNPTGICGTCEYFVGGAQKLHSKNITQKKIGLYMNTLCYQLNKEEKTKCLEDISKYLTEVLQLLDLGLTQRAVCYSINLCPQQKPTATEVATNITTAQTTTLAPVPTTKKHDNKICHDCKAFFNDLRQLLQSNQTVKRVEDLFDSTICATLGPFTDMCRQLIAAFVPAYLQDVSEFVDPGFLCSIMEFCPESQKATFFKALAEKSPLKSADMSADAKECSNCKMFVENIKKQIDSDTTIDKMKAILEKDVCDHLGNYKSVCRMAVETYAQEILEDILSQVNDSVVCQKLGLCNGYVVMRAVVSHLEAVKFSKPNPFRESTECELCKVLLAELHSLVEDPQVQNAVKDFLNNEVCVRLGEMKEACLTLVKEYEPLIMKAIQGLLEPKNGCAMLGMCTNSSRPNIIVVPKSPIVDTVSLSQLVPGSPLAPYQRVGLVLPPKTAVKASESEQCKLCKMVMGELEKILKDRTIEKDIEIALDEVCSFLPSSMAKQCTDFVNEYTPGIIELILSQIDPKMVCSALQLCASTTVSVPVPDALGCSYCSEILGIASGHLSADPKMNQRDFETMLLKLCSKYGEQYKHMCAPGVQQFGDTVFKALKGDMAPREVCGMIGFCAASAIKPETKHYMGVMCELLKSAGVKTECKEFNQISKEINHNFLKNVMKKAGSTETNALKPKSKNGGMTCAVCKDVVNYLKAFVVDKQNEEKLRKMLHEVCHYLEPTYLSKECDSLVDQYEDKLIHLLIQQLPAEEVCEAIGLCSTKVWKNKKN